MDIVTDEDKHMQLKLSALRRMRVFFFDGIDESATLQVALTSDKSTPTP